MAVNVDDKIKKLSPVQRKKVEARAAELIAEEMTLRELRKARKLTQVRIAKALGVTQDSVSRLEKRSDLLLSTLRKTVRAMGGNLSLVAEFPDRAPVVLSGIAEEESTPQAVRARLERRLQSCGSLIVYPTSNRSTISGDVWFSGRTWLWVKVKSRKQCYVLGLRRRACALTFSAIPLPQTDPFDALLGRRDFSESLFSLVRPVRFELTTFCSGGKSISVCY
jgi:transcriptional regulator with XRE-family HTH domain